MVLPRRRRGRLSVVWLVLLALDHAACVRCLAFARVAPLDFGAVPRTHHRFAGWDPRCHSARPQRSEKEKVKQEAGCGFLSGFRTKAPRHEGGWIRSPDPPNPQSRVSADGFGAASSFFVPWCLCERKSNSIFCLPSPRIPMDSGLYRAVKCRHDLPIRSRPLGHIHSFPGCWVDEFIHFLLSECVT